MKETSLGEKAIGLEEALSQVRESYNELSNAFHFLDFDPQRIDEINERLFSLKTLQRKYGRTSEEILAKYQEYKDKLEFSATFQMEKDKREKELDNLYSECVKCAESFYIEEEKAGAKLTEAISKEMSDLGLRKNGFFIEFEKGELSKTGLYDCHFLVQLNDGIEKASLRKAASGGESSRLMLALKIVLNHINPYDLVVLDEIDTGVSGKQASLIAKKISMLSLTSSVLVISHLAQVVSSAKSAIYIQKKTANGVTKTTAMNMSEEEIISFIAKMLSGNNITEAARKQAEELRNEYR